MFLPRCQIRDYWSLQFTATLGDGFFAFPYLWHPVYRVCVGKTVGRQQVLSAFLFSAEQNREREAFWHEVSGGENYCGGKDSSG